jgi:hypothetical protein
MGFCCDKLMLIWGGTFSLRVKQKALGRARVLCEVRVRMACPLLHSRPHAHTRDWKRGKQPNSRDKSLYIHHIARERPRLSQKTDATNALENSATCSLIINCEQRVSGTSKIQVQRAAWLP